MVLMTQKLVVLTLLMDEKVKGTVHWVSTKYAYDAEIRLYDRLFTIENPLSKKKKNSLTS